MFVRQEIHQLHEYQGPILSTVSVHHITPIASYHPSLDSDTMFQEKGFQIMN